MPTYLDTSLARRGPAGGTTNPDARIQRASRRMLYAIPFYLVCVTFELAANRYLPGANLMRWLAIYTLMGVGTFWWLIVSGRTQQWADPGMVYVQTMFAVTAAAAAYLCADGMRGPALELMCVAIVFDMHRLKLRQIITAAVTGAVLLWVGLFGLWLAGHPGLDMAKEVANLAMTLMSIGAMCAIAWQSLKVRRLQSEQNAALNDAVARVQHLAHHDALTGLANRRHGAAQFERLCTDAPPAQRPITVALVDIDHFKRANDRHGHATGDAVLQAVAALLRSSLSAEYTMVRWGGEEFLLLMPRTTVDHGLQQVERFRRLVMGHDWSVLAKGLHVTVSIGVTCVVGTEALATVVQRADAALYRCKALGRNQSLRGC